MHQDTIEVADDRIDGPHGPVPIRRYRPRVRSAGKGSPTLVWVHGGGFFRGDLDLPESHAVARALAERGLPVVTVDYRLGPLPGLPWLGRGGPRGRRRAPHARDEIVAALRHLQDEAPAGLLLGGASAGACLAASAVATAPPLVGLVLTYGFFHARLPRDPAVRRLVRGHRRLTHAPLLLDLNNRAYAGGRPAAVHPASDDLGGFPRTLLIDAERDVMRASGQRFANELEAADVEVERHVLPGSRHAFLNRPGTRDFDDTIERVAEWADRTPIR
ncbi:MULTISPECIES: alpha/beta hydrolase [Curtobacterium]|uniref:alpha/beta hydrolase n=1 Tax=Curtobacterium TaxID=2034 RepID=UPI00217D33FE|nr:alpha/beta hydrolase [Curtobacterium flaccumfaciens]MCS6562612.1 alpha/beta hydrolase [Curtobacterium flaccumfaciens pv. poinsettiae]UXN28653.1 alpha/beta hydrolase [Curtobacterium flaccumfaciens]